MDTVNLSSVGGLTTEILAKMGNSKLALLTSDKIAQAVALPHTNNRQAACQAAQQYIALANNGHNDAVKVGRLKGTLLAKLASAGMLVVLRRHIPVAVLLSLPTDMIHAERGAKHYLEVLGIIVDT